MSLETPLFIQSDDPDTPIEYSAREVRTLIEAMFPAEGVIDPASGGFEVTQRAAGANMSVDVAAGIAVVEGDDQATQGFYVIRSTATENVVIPAAPVSNSRIDIVYAQVNDPNAGGDAGSDFELAVISGTPAASPSPPTLPDTAIALAYVTVASGVSSIVTADIEDQRFIPASDLAGGIVAMSKLTGAETTASTSFVSLTTVLSADAVIGASGMCLVIINARVNNTVSTSEVYVTLELSGANTLAAGTANQHTGSAKVPTTDAVNVARVALLTGLDPGLTTFTEKVKVDAGTGEFNRRHHVIIPL